jgi:hypothetical protein
MSKHDREILKYSDPVKVLEKLHHIFGKDSGIELFRSSRKDKKYAIINPYTFKVVHFGQMGYEDFTKTGDERRRELFKRRNHKWRDADPFSPAFLSYHLLW